MGARGIHSSVHRTVYRISVYGSEPEISPAAWERILTKGFQAMQKISLAQSAAVATTGLPSQCN